MRQCRVALNWFLCNRGPRVQERKYCGYHLQKVRHPRNRGWSGAGVLVGHWQLSAEENSEYEGTPIEKVDEGVSYVLKATNQVALDSFVISDGFLHIFQATNLPSR
jgi:hypothetical protein